MLNQLKRKFVDAVVRISADVARGEGEAVLQRAVAQQAAMRAQLEAALAASAQAQAAALSASVEAQAAAISAAVDPIWTALPERDNATVNRTLHMMRGEYTVMPRFAFHQPLDYLNDTVPPNFAPPVFVEGERLALPPPGMRGGYSDDDQEYLATGRNHQAIYLEQIRKHHGLKPGMVVMELGCATGRVLRHFHQQKEELDWKMVGCDVQADHVEWLRQNWPLDINVYVGSVFPKLPFEDNSIDVIYGMSVFTHIKYHWDFWLLELKRVLKPGGLLLQTIHAERAWSFYYDNQHLDWVRAAISPHIFASREMNMDFLLSGDIAVSQTFFKQEVARKYWGRYLEVCDILSPDDQYWFQDLMICRK